MSDDKPRNLDDTRLEEFEARALEQITQDQIDELIDRVDADTSKGDKFDLLAWSAAGLGAQAALIYIEQQRRENGMSSTQSEMLDGIRQSLDDAIIEAADHPVALTLAKIREPLAEFDKRQRKQAVESCLVMFTAQTGLHANFLVTPGVGPFAMTDFKFLAVGLTEAGRNPLYFYGWVSKHLRPPISCYCARCVSIDYQQWKPSEKLDPDALTAHHGGEESAYRSFGREVFEGWLSQYRGLLTHAEAEIGVNPVAATEFAHGLFSRLTSGKSNG